VSLIMPQGTMTVDFDLLSYSYDDATHRTKLYSIVINLYLND